MNSVGSLISDDITQSCVIVDLWRDDFRIPDIISKSRFCIHSLVKDDKCVRCGSFVGFFGFESDPILYFNHINLLANSLPLTKDLYIISKRYYPPDYKRPYFEGVVTGGLMRYATTYIIRERSSDTGRTFFVAHFTSDKSRFRSKSFEMTRKWSLDSLTLPEDVLLVNPRIPQVKVYPRGFILYISNTRVDEFHTDILNNRLGI